MDLKASLENYRNITIELIEKVKKGEDLNTLLQKRGELIENIKRLNFTNEEFQTIAKSFDILKLEEKFQESINKEKENIKEKIRFVNITREARIKYESSQFRPTFFNKKI